MRHSHKAVADLIGLTAAVITKQGINLVLKEGSNVVNRNNRSVNCTGAVKIIARKSVDNSEILEQGLNKAIKLLVVLKMIGVGLVRNVEQNIVLNSQCLNALN